MDDDARQSAQSGSLEVNAGHRGIGPDGREDECWGRGYRTKYTYDADGSLETVTYPSGLLLRYERDAATGRVREVRNASTGLTYASAVTHYPDGPVSSLVFGNGLRLDQALDQAYRPDVIASGDMALDYTMSPAGDVQTIDQGATHHRFGYGDLGRLAEFSPGLPSATASSSNVFAHDRLVESIGAGSAGLRHAFGYDQQSNLSGIAAVSSGGAPASALCLKHDALGRLVLAGTTAFANVSADGIACTRESDVTQAIARFKYDWRNMRVARWSATTGRWTYFTNRRDGYPLEESVLYGETPQAPWVPRRDYVWLDSLPLAQIEHSGEGASRRADPYYIHADHLGRPRRMSSQAGQTVWWATAWPYGDQSESTAADMVTGRTIVTNLRLPGQYDERLLASVGLQGPYYNWNRWYLPGVGRYLELDPLALRGGLNGRGAPDWYSYALGNPLRFTDRNGAVAVADDLLILAGAAALVAAWETYVAQCTAAGTCPWSPKKCEPFPWNPPRVEPVPIPLPWETGRPKLCGCFCLDIGGVRNWAGPMPEWECADTCFGGRPPFNKVHPGYQCGGNPVWRITPVN